MPWTAKDAEEHTEKANTPEKRKTWAKIANKAHADCIKDGGDAKECDGRAIRIANAAIAKVKESDMPYKAYTMSTNNVLISVNAIDVGGEAVPVGELVAAYQATSGASQADDLFAGDGELNEATKTVDGKPRPAGDFLVVEDPDKPSTWHLPVKRNGKLDRKLCGGAWAALFDPKGYRGNKYEGPDKSAAIKKLKAIYKAQGWETPAAESESGFTEAVAGSLEDYAMSVKDAFRVAFKDTAISTNAEVGHELWPRDVFKDSPDLGDVVVVRDDGSLYAVEYNETDEGFQFATRENWRKVVLTYVPVKEETAEVAEAQLSESASGHAIALAETQAVTGGPRAPLLMDIALIKPGWGNRKDNHYYSREVLARDAHVFEGVKMYATDHRQDEKSVRTEVAVVKQCPVSFTDDGAPVARVAIHDGGFAEAARNRDSLGTLTSLENSILAVGRTKKGKAPDGKKGNIVEAITAGTSVDFVTRAGAGGHAIALAESNTGGDAMSEEEQTTTQEQEQEEGAQEATLSEGQQQEVTYLAESEVKAALEASRLPRQAQERLAEGQYLDAEALTAAVEAERAYVKELTGSGKPFAQGDTAPADATMSEAEYDAEYSEILKRHAVYVPEKEVT